MPTTYNFTGQRVDSEMGLLYYNFRYYDPVSGRFVRADTTQTNAGGMDPYAYVGDNPETKNDPTGHDGWNWGLIIAVVAIVVVVAVVAVVAAPVLIAAAATAGEVAATAAAADGAAVAGAAAAEATTAAVADTAATVTAETAATAATETATTAATETATTAATETATTAATETATTAADTTATTATDTTATTTANTATTDTAATETTTTDVLSDSINGPCSFTAPTQVTTAHGEESIGKLHVGEQVLAYNPKTRTMELEPILHVWVHSDHDLVDLTITTSIPGRHGTPATQTSEVVHTTSEHPFFTTEQGFVPAGKLHTGMHLLRANGSVGVITGWKLVPGTKVMYNLEVAQDHTFVVGDGQWVVHNNCGDRAGPLEIQNGIELIQDPNGKFGSESPDINWTFVRVTRGTSVANPPYQGYPYTLRYYFTFRNQWGELIYISANYDPYAHEWDTSSFHYSSWSP